MAAARAATAEPTVLPSWRSMQEVLLGPLDVLVLETGEDIAALVRCVYETYDRMVDGSRPRIIAVVSPAALEFNPSLREWEIRGGPALTALLLTDGTDVERYVTDILQQLRQPG